MSYVNRDRTAQPSDESLTATLVVAFAALAIGLVIGLIATWIIV
jgi:ABC-type sulfate transport system permease component